MDTPTPPADDDLSGKRKGPIHREPLGEFIQTFRTEICGPGMWHGQPLLLRLTMLLTTRALTFCIPLHMTDLAGPLWALEHSLSFSALRIMPGRDLAGLAAIGIHLSMMAMLFYLARRMGAGVQESLRQHQ